MNEPIVKKSEYERAMILVVAIIIVIVILIIATPFLFKFGFQTRITEKSYSSLAAFNLDDAGVDWVLWKTKP